jgi:protein-L-isoaspartate(D-aspartate) O-methyltransferase
MTDELVSKGSIRDEAWRKVFPTVPRHLFVPGHSLSEAYGMDAIVTQIKSARTSYGVVQDIPTSSLSSPIAVAVMLDRLGLADGQRVAEIGTGTGYNTALLCARVGDASVWSIDIDPGLVAEASERLDTLVYHPTLMSGDGHDGIPGGAPYDAILATCSVGQIPPEWIRQLAVGGRIVAPLTSAHDGPLAVLTKTADDRVVGHLDAERTFFMPLRPELDNPLATPFAAQPSSLPSHGTTVSTPSVLADEADPDLWWFLHLHIPGLTTWRTNWEDGRTTLGIADDSSTAEVGLHQADPDESMFHVTHRGPRRLWDTVEHAFKLYLHLGEPDRSRFGITALDRLDQQWVWLDNPDGTYIWPLPL